MGKFGSSVNLSEGGGIIVDFIIENQELLINAGIILLSIFGGGSAVAFKLLPGIKIANTISSILIKNIEKNHPEKRAKIKIDIQTDAVLKNVDGYLDKKVVELT